MGATQNEEDGLTVKARLNLKIDEELKDWAMDYALKHGMTVTQIICDYFRSLRAAERREANEELVEQI